MYPENRCIKKNIKTKNSKEINLRHNAEKENLKIDEFSDINNLNILWEKKLEELQTRSQSALDELKKSQEMEYQKVFPQYQEVPGI